MLRNITFDCPSCGAPITTPENMLAVHCDYCGNNLTVPAELRPPPPPQIPYAPPTNIYINTSSQGGPIIPGQFYINPAQQQASRRISRGVSCFIIGMILFVVLVTVVPILITSWTIFDVFKHIPSVPGR